MKNIQTDAAPRAIGPYSQAVYANGFLFVSGQIALHPDNGELVGTDIESQSRRALANLQAIVESSGGKLSDVVRTTVFLTDLSDFSAFNTVYQTFFGNHRPARSTVQVASLPKGSRVEIDAIAALS